MLTLAGDCAELRFFRSLNVTGDARFLTRGLDDLRRFFQSRVAQQREGESIRAARFG